MKKFNWKALLIAVMVIVMVCALAACDPKTDDNSTDPGYTLQKPTKITSTQYFDELWKISEGIGDKEFAEGEDISLKADLGITLGTREYAKVDKEIAGFKNEQSIELGIRLELLLDRTNPTNNHSALKAKIYSGDVEVLGLFFTLTEPDNLYIDFAGQKILFPLHVELTYDGQDYSNQSLGALLKKGLAAKFNINAKQTSLDEILSTVVGDMGEGWNLDNLVNAILPVIGFEPDAIIEMVNGFMDGLGDILKDEKTGTLSIKKALNDPMIGTLIKPDTVQRGNEYVLTSSMLNDLVGGNICSSRASARLEIGFEKGGDSVAIAADIESSGYNKMGNKHPFLKLQIKDLEFGNKDDKVELANKKDYSKDAQFEITERLDLSGVTLNGEQLKSLEIGAKLKLDLEEEDLAQNASQANLYLSYNDTKLLEASFVGGRLAVTAKTDAKVGNYDLFNMLVKGFGPAAYNLVKEKFFHGQDNEALTQFADAFFTDETHTAINPDFKGAVWTGLNPTDLYQTLVDYIVSLFPAPTALASEEAAATGATFDATSISDLLYLAFQNAVKTLEDGKITLQNDDIVQFVCDIVNEMFNLPYNDVQHPENNEPKWTLDGCAKEVKNFVIKTVASAQNPETEELTEAMLTKAENDIESTLEEVFTGENEAYAHLTVKGIDFTKKGTKTYLEYLVSSLLSGLKANVTLDLTHGIGWTVEATTAGGVTATYKSEIKATTKPAKQADLSAGVTDATEGWFFWDTTKA